jgi:hypothetical protein
MQQVLTTGGRCPAFGRRPADRGPIPIACTGDAVGQKVTGDPRVKTMEDP